MLALALALTLAHAPPAAKGPSAFETAKLFFLAGDVARAEEAARAGLARDGKRCRALLRLLAEYGYLANRMDDFTPDQAKAFVELDAKIAPGAVGKLTQKTLERFVDKPLEVARLRAEAGDAVGAAAIARETLKVVPGHPETLAFIAGLSPDGGVASAPDGGTPQPR